MYGEIHEHLANRGLHFHTKKFSFQKLAADRGISLSCFFGSRGYFGNLNGLVYG